MSRFNLFAPRTKKTVNLAGGEAYSQTPEMELVSLLLTSFATDQFYRSADQTFDKLKNLIAKCDKEFVAKAAVYARNEFGMRSISHVLASELAKHVSGAEWAKYFYAAIVRRPDDMMEILSYHMANNGKIPNALKKGFASAFAKFDTYQLAKYRGTHKTVKLVDVVNLVHPKPTERNAEAINALVKDELRALDTWESQLTKAGQAAETDDEKADFKRDVWVNLIREKKIGYFALLRNLRNILQQAPEVIPDALASLTNENLIKKSLVLPFRFTTAYDEILKLNLGRLGRDVLVALSRAVNISISNVPKFDGKTLVVLDVSGSMAGRPAQIGSLFTAALLKSNNADFMTFSDYAQYKNYNPLDSTLSIAQGLKFSSGGTNFHAIFQVANKRYDRIIILSDMQGWIGGHSPVSTYNAYRQKYKANPFIYSFDLQGYGSLQFPQNNVFCLAGFSDKVFDIMKLLETNKAALVDRVREVSFVN